MISSGTTVLKTFFGGWAGRGVERGVRVNGTMVLGGVEGPGRGVWSGFCGGYGRWRDMWRVYYEVMKSEEERKFDNAASRLIELACAA